MRIGATRDEGTWAYLGGSSLFGMSACGNLRSKGRQMYTPSRGVMQQKYVAGHHHVGCTVLYFRKVLFLLQFRVPSLRRSDGTLYRKKTVAAAQMDCCIRKLAQLGYPRGSTAARCARPVAWRAWP
jgi:hypothetical protein